MRHLTLAIIGIVAFALGTAAGMLLVSPAPWLSGSSGTFPGVRYDFHSGVAGRPFTARVEEHDFANEPAWDGNGPLTLNPDAAIKSASKAMSENKDASSVAWTLESVTLRQIMPTKYIYVVTFAPAQIKTHEDRVTHYQVLVYLSGRVQLPVARHGT